MTEKKKKTLAQILFLISTPKLAERATKLYADDNIPLHYRLSAYGTASNEMRDILGLDSTEKAAMLSILPRDTARETLARLRRLLRIDSTNSGIAFTIPITAASRLALRIMESTTSQAENTEKRRNNRMGNNKYAMIAAIVNQGYSENVMEAARAAGAQGGTVIHSRSVGNEAISGAWGFAIEDEREIVIIAVESDTKLAIMQAISDACGIKSNAKGIVISLPIEDAIGLGD
jgi:DNA-binding transcriptional ArsR family regulator